jgi:signal transduction histidine kinase/DNA-binding response OmpR family regulator
MNGNKSFIAPDKMILGTEESFIPSWPPFFLSMMHSRAETAPIERERVRVLLVEDNPGDARLVEIALEESEVPTFDLKVEGRLAPALSRLRSDRFDMVLLDLNLPDSRGFQTVTSVQEVAPNIPVVIITGAANEEFARKAIHAGAQDYLVKDEIMSHSLVRSILFAMERKRTENDLHALERVASSAVATLDLGSLLEVTLRTLIEEMRGDRAAILLLDRGELRIRAEAGLRGGKGDPFYDEADERLNQQVMGEGEPLFNQMWLGAEGLMLSVLKAPLHVEGKVAGVVEVEWDGPHPESHLDRNLLSVAAERISAGIANARAYERVTLSEKAAREERLRLRTIIDTLPVGILITDAKGAQVESNALRSTIWRGVPRASRGIEDLCELKTWYTDLRKEVKECPVVRALRYGETTLGALLDIERMDGTIGTILNSAAPIKDANGMLVGAVGVQQDVSLQIQLERELAEAKDRAEFYIDLLTHDVNNSLAAASGYLQLLSNEEGHTEKVERWLGRAGTSLDEAVRLIETVRKVHSTRSSPALVRVDLDELLPTIIGQTLSRERPEVEIYYSGSHDAEVWGTDLLPDLFANILENSVKHAPGDVRIVVAVRPQNEPGERLVRVEVADNGPGIPDELKSRLFTRGGRGSSRVAGHGIGLFLASNIVKGAGGKIWVEDRVPGDYRKGARFIVTLRRADD